MLTIMDAQVRCLFTCSAMIQADFGASISAVFKILTKATTISAFHDYSHEFDVPWCHESTRVAALKISDWVDFLIDVNVLNNGVVQGCWDWKFCHCSNYGRGSL